MAAAIFENPLNRSYEAISDLGERLDVPRDGYVVSEHAPKLEDYFADRAVEIHVDSLWP